MKLELKENMYVRTKDGIIAKVDYIDDDTIFFDKDLYRTYGDGIDFLEKDNLERIIKASYNIINILEVGDVILFYEDIDNYKKQYVIGIPDLITLDEIKDKITNDNIRLVSILTKKELEQMAYKEDFNGFLD